MIGRLGIFGGTFDPIHLAHLILAEQPREQLRLDRVLFVPAAAPPHKDSVAISPSKVRLEMVELAIAGHPQFEVSDLESRREGPSYTVDTLRSLKDEHPSAELFLLLGGDSLHDFPSWRDPGTILSLAHLGVMHREASEPASKSFVLEDAVSECVSFIETPTLAISSTDLRRRVREGRSIRYFVPAAVEAYVITQKLYRNDSTG